MMRNIGCRAGRSVLLLSIFLLSGCLGAAKTEQTGESQKLDEITDRGDELAVDYFDLVQEIGAYQSWDLAVGDLDGDGFLDLFVSSLGQDDPKVWFNDGAGNLVPADQEMPGCSRTAVGDVNGDGLADIIIAEWQPDQPLWSSLLSVWLNDGGGSFSRGNELLVSEGAHKIVLGDFNADQALDVFVLGTGQNEVWINDGKGIFEYFDQDLPTGIDSAGGAGDLDGDGDLDILAGGWEGAPGVWLNDGAGRFSRSGISIIDEDLHIHGLALGDLDADGDLDALVVLANQDPHQVWINDGAGGFTVSQNLQAPLGHAAALGDLDGDGDLDAVTGHGNQGGGFARLWLNDGSGRFTDSSLMLGDNFTTAVVLGDLDRDQDLDLISAQSEWGEEVGPPDLVWMNGDLLRRLPGNLRLRDVDEMSMLFVPSGIFLMGAGQSDLNADQGEKPAHQVKLDDFWIDETEVSNRQYSLCVVRGDCAPSRYSSNEEYNGDNYPVVGIGWQDAQDYCAWAGGRLPTEAEWEYAARGNEGLIYPWGNDYDGRLLNACDVNCGKSWADPEIDDGYQESAPAGSYPAGASWVGALDMAGNVWEWVRDWCGEYDGEYSDNSMGPEQGRCKIIRGGAWASPPAGVRTTYRMINSSEISPDIRHPNIGFRCVYPGSNDAEVK